MADIAGKASVFLITPFLANRMGAAEFGVLNLYLSVNQILTFAIALGGPSLLAVEYVRNGYTAARRLRAANLRVALWGSVILLGLSLAASWCAPSIIPLASGVLIVAASFVYALNTIELSYYRGAQTYALAVAGQFTFAALHVLLTILIFSIDSATAANRLLSIALAGALVQTVYALQLHSKRYDLGTKEIRRSNTSVIIKFGLSIAPHVTSQWIRASIDLFVILAYFGAATTGSYSLANTLAMAASILFIVINKQIQPFAYRRLNNRDFSGFWRIQIWFSLAVLGITAVYYGVLQLSFGLLFGSEYDSAKSLLPALLGGYAAQSIYTVSTTAAFYERRAGQISSVTAGALLVHLVGLGVLAILGQVDPTYVAVVFFISNVVAMLGMAWLSRRLVGELRVARPELTGQV